MIVVSDASPLISLARIRELSLLRDLYDRVVVPEAVWQEVAGHGNERDHGTPIESVSWIEEQEVDNRSLVQALRQDLDAGEAEAIALAVERAPALLVMDERLGRQTARHLEVPCIGVVGVLVEAKHSGHIDGIKPVLDRLRDEAGFYLSTTLYRRVLDDANEL